MVLSTNDESKAFTGIPTLRKQRASSFEAALGTMTFGESGVGLRTRPVPFPSLARAGFLSCRTISLASDSCAHQARWRSLRKQAALISGPRTTFIEGIGLARTAAREISFWLSLPQCLNECVIGASSGLALDG